MYLYIVIKIIYCYNLIHTININVFEIMVSINFKNLFIILDEIDTKSNVINPQPLNIPSSTKNVVFTTKNNIFGDPYNEPNANAQRRSPLNSQIANNGVGHNPLTNPLPLNIQNPYIAREYAKAQNAKNIFSNAADRNLVNKI